MITIIADAFATASAAIAPPKKRTRRYHPPGPLLDEPQFRRLTLPDGAEVAHVALHGRGYGKEMTLDAADWPFVQSLGPVAWTLAGLPRGRTGYVCSGTAAIRHLCPDSRAAFPMAILARVMTGATKREVVQYADGNPLNLRRGNLVITGRRAFMDALKAAGVVARSRPATA